MNQLLAQVTVDPMGNWEATINPNLPDRDKVMVALRSVQLFAKIAGDGFATLEGLDRPKILVPQMVVR